MAWAQRTLSLKARTRGCHLITREVVGGMPELANFRIGLAHIFICHTSASLSINENASPDVRDDLESHLNHIVPENQPHYTHVYEGPDDMPAHIKASMMGSSVSIPITGGKLGLGTWQGIYLLEHRDHGGSRRITVTFNGE